MNDKNEGVGSLTIANILLVIVILAVFLMGYFVYKFFQQPIPPTVTTTQTFAETPKDEPVVIQDWPCNAPNKDCK